VHDARVSAEPDGRTVRVMIGGGAYTVHLPLGSRLDQRFVIDGRAVSFTEYYPDRWLLEVDGRSYRLQRARALSIEQTAGHGSASAGAGRLTAPMSGRIVKIAVQEGQQVRSNQPLVVLEAMKMEHVVEAPHAGLIQKVCVEVGQQVASGAVLVELGDVE